MKSVLLKEWDPIGIADMDEAQDEYDLYAAKLTAMIMRGAAENEILNHLTWIEVDRMGLEGDLLHRSNIARKLSLLKI
ncbi:hypothetical protein [Verminephrobacter eiseniae]|uniref:hypothetical protein n=1 Tax=Verminephrobacter eiseniae TaxID=364317 RepID=UPI002237AC78|nr:hypothetical protein [Verminephrobacter eiseniae]